MVLNLHLKLAYFTVYMKYLSSLLSLSHSFLKLTAIKTYICLNIMFMNIMTTFMYINIMTMLNLIN